MIIHVDMDVFYASSTYKALANFYERIKVLRAKAYQDFEED